MISFYLYFLAGLASLYYEINIFNMITSPEEAAAVTIINQEELQKRIKIEKDVANAIKEMVDQVEFVVSSGPHHDYFLGEASRKLKLKEMDSKYSKLIQSKLFFEIQTGKTKISSNKQSYMIAQKHQPTIEQLIQKDKNSIKLKKKHAIEALNEVLRQENELVKHQKGLIESRLLTKSQIYIEENPQWREDLKRAIKRNRELEKSLEMKSQQADKRAISLKEEALKTKKERLQRLRQSNMKMLQQKRQRESLLKEKQKQFQSKCQQFVQKNKPKKYRFEIMSEKGEENLKIIEQQRDQKIQKYKEMKQKYDWSEIKQHQAKYFETMCQKKEEWIRKFQQSVSRVNKRHQKSVFAERIEQQQNQKEMEERLKENRKRQFLQKIKQYGASVLQNHMPRNVVKSSNILTKDDRSTARHSLNRSQQRQKGLAFLKVAKHRKLTHDVKNKQIKAALSLPTIKAPLYKDYLKQQPKRARQVISFQTVLSQKKGQWASNAKSIIHKLDLNNKKDDKKLVQSAFKKIQLLKAIL